MKIKRLVLINVCLVVVALMVALNPPIQTVVADSTTTVGTGTADSCTEAALDAALAVGGQINFNCGAAAVFINVQAEKDITKATILNGDGLITISGMDATRIFKVAAGGSLELDKLTLVYGAANDSAAARDGDGGAIFNDGGAVTLTDASVLESRADHRGGAIYNRSGSLTLLRTTLGRNNAGDYGSGFFNETGTVQLFNSTLSTNFAGKSGGGIYDLAGNVSLMNVTLYNNNAGLNGDALGIGPKATLTAINTIFARAADTTINPLGVNCTGTLTDSGNNLQFPDKSCGDSVQVADPKLDSLLDNGKYARTHALKTGSPAIDAGNQPICDADPVAKLDERNGPRTIGKACDIGAYEYDPNQAAVVANNISLVITGVNVCSCSEPSCPAGQFYNPRTGLCTPPNCPRGTVYNPRTGKCEPPSCPTGTTYNPRTGKCEPPPTTCPPGTTFNPSTGLCACPPGLTLNANGQCVPSTCPPGQTFNPTTGLCTCPPGLTLNANGQCVPSTCPPGQTFNPSTGLCACPPGLTLNVDGRCACPRGLILNPTTGKCEPPACPPGQVRNPLTGQCGCPPGTIYYPGIGCGPILILIPTHTPVPPPVCPRGQILDPKSNQCVCPPGYTFYGSGANKYCGPILK